jgi:hypothetical protein
MQQNHNTPGGQQASNIAGRDWAAFLEAYDAQRAADRVQEAICGRPTPERVRHGWGELLSRYPWDWFATLTFRRDVGVGAESASRNFKTWLYESLLQEALRRDLATRASASSKAKGVWPNLYRKKRRAAVPVYVLGIEEHQDGVIHLHALVRLPAMLSKASRRAAHGVWWTRHGFARIEPPKSQGEVASYVSKYVVKDGELEISESFDAAKLPAA